MKETNNTKELLLYKKTEMLFLRIHPALRNYPKFERYSLCNQIRDNFLNLMKFIILANNVKSKRKSYQEQADGYLQVCKILMKLSYNRRYIGENFYKEIESSLVEIGKILSSWIKSSVNKKV